VLASVQIGWLTKTLAEYFLKTMLNKMKAGFARISEKNNLLK
jgi:hypothetical protein